MDEKSICWELSEIIRQDFDVSVHGLISVNDVSVARDICNATVHVSVLGTPQQQEAVPALLKMHAPRLRGRLARNVVLRHVPVLYFKIDDAIEEGSRVVEILNQLEKDFPTS